MDKAPSRAIRAGALYFAVVFAAGFALGALRVTAIAPRLGEIGAVLIEAPAMLVIAWAACGATLRRVPVASTLRARSVMGGVAFALLIGSELSLAAALTGGPRAWLAGLVSTPGAIGLAAQVAFAVFPVVQRRG